MKCKNYKIVIRLIISAAITPPLLRNFVDIASLFLLFLEYFDESLVMSDSYQREQISDPPPNQLFANYESSRIIHTRMTINVEWLNVYLGLLT